MRGERDKTGERDKRGKRGERDKSKSALVDSPLLFFPHARTDKGSDRLLLQIQHM